MKSTKSVIIIAAVVSLLGVARLIGLIGAYCNFLGNGGGGGFFDDGR